jgi:predicted porin
VSDQSDVWELAARYEGQVSNVGVIAGAGYTAADLETAAAGDDDFQEWNVGVDLDIGAFGLGAIYTENNNSDDSQKMKTTHGFWVLITPLAHSKSAHLT